MDLWPNGVSAVPTRSVKTLIRVLLVMVLEAAGIALLRALWMNPHPPSGRAFQGLHRKSFALRPGCSAKSNVNEAGATESGSGSALGLKRFRSSVPEANGPPGEVKPQSVSEHIDPKEHWDWLGEGVVQKFSDGETWRMQGGQECAARNQCPVNFLQRFGNVHVGQGNSGDDAIKTFIIKG